MLVASALIALLSLPVLACAGYLLLLALLSARRAPPPYGPATLHFDIVVPAHDEERGIGETVRSLLAVDYPTSSRRVLVVADNCTDATAARAEAAGAQVLVRSDSEKKGKGYALKFAFDQSIRDGFADAVVVVDADTLVSPNLLHAFAARFKSGAKAAQAEYGVRNPRASWRTRLMVIALAMFHGVRSHGRERLGVSCGLRGNGMAFLREVVERVPHEAFSIVEDLEYGIRLARAGIVVRYTSEACVLGEMVSSEQGSRSQRRRWEGGRMAMMRSHGWPLLVEALRKRDAVLFDMAVDVLVPPLSYVFGVAVMGSVAALVLYGWAAHGGDPAAHPMVSVSASAGVLLWLGALAMLLVYVARGIVLSGAGIRGLVDLTWAPVYIVWKVALSLSPSAKRAGGTWVRTSREDEKRARE
jgi:cellulose synthase/poly-beta-1,6-N-acetylglucosamine synthase-like glycosyltransferase